MAVETLKSTPITNLDATPIVPNTVGEGGLGTPREVEGFVTFPASASIGSTARLARVPSTAKIKVVNLESEAQAAGATDVGVYYSTAHKTGAGAVIDADFFGSAVSVAAAVQPPTNVTGESGVYTLDKRTQPLWQAAGLTTDPGGFFDVVLTLTTAITTGTGKTGIRVSYVD